MSSLKYLCIQVETAGKPRRAVTKRKVHARQAGTVQYLLHNYTLSRLEVRHMHCRTSTRYVQVCHEILRRAVALPEKGCFQVLGGVVTRSV
jgi:hypothetical protein